MSPTSTLRPLAAADLDGVSRVHWRACRIAYRFMGWSYSEDQVRRWHAGKMSEWDWARVAVSDDGAIVGYLAAIGPHLDQLFVDPDQQRTGVGRLLLEAMLGRDLGPITLHVFAGNRPAWRFYESFGFRQAHSWWDAEHAATCLTYRLDRVPTR